MSSAGKTASPPYNQSSATGNPQRVSSLQHQFNRRRQCFSSFPLRFAQLLWWSLQSLLTPKMSVMSSVPTGEALTNAFVWWRFRCRCCYPWGYTWSNTVTEEATINDHSQPCSCHHQCNCRFAKTAACPSNAALLSPTLMALQIGSLLGAHPLRPTV